MKEIVPLWKHQREAAERAANEHGFAFFFEMGAGKTLTAVTTLRHLCNRERGLLRTLIVCPPVVKTAWEREILRGSTIPKDQLHILGGSGKDRLKTFKTHAAAGGIFITNYESLLMKGLFKEIKGWGPEVLIFDESQMLKSFGAKRTKLAIELSDIAHWRYLLSGTPILNSPMDIWSQYRILDGGASFDRNFYAFRGRWFEDKNAGMPKQKYFPDWRPRAGLQDAFNKLIYKKAVRVLKKDCLDLPPLVRQRLEVELTAEQLKMYDSMKKHFVAYLNDKACVASIALTKGLRLMQIVSGHWVDDEGNEHSFKNNPRVEALGSLLEEIGGEHKVIVWSCFRHGYADIAGVCDRLGLAYRTLYGGMTDKQRQEAVDSFQTDPSVRVMIANQAAGGTGVTLTAASYAVYMSRSFNLEHDMQSEARCHRGGSEVHAKITRVDIVAPGTIDDLVLAALERKEDMAESILRIGGKL
ncbi:MAG: DEAD/DEAH box helicase [Chroococcales cyanobacterium metabat2.561]|nr:MAG: DEAD/DEAH box helicase [Chroococcales cyanobacterium metabat2.561]